MDELRAYVDALFARRGDTAENREMKEEIYGNLAARRDDLIAQGVPEAEAVRAAKETIDDIRVAQVVEQDLTMDDKGGIIYRTKLRVSFKIRPPKSS